MKLQTTYETNNYPIIIEHNALKHLRHYIENYKDIVLVVDNTIAQKWDDTLEFITSEYDAHMLSVPSGEFTKSQDYYAETIETLLSKNMTRYTCIIAVRGGAIVDFVGFLFVILYRGVHFIQGPTTILPHHSSVGGTVEINSKHGQNLI